MSYLTDNPDLMLEVLIVLVRRAGGAVTIGADEAPGETNLLSKLDGDKFHLVIDASLEDVQGFA